MDDVDLDGSGDVTREEFQTLIERILSFPVKGQAIITNQIWSEMDWDSDGVLSQEEFEFVARRMSVGLVKVEPVLVYPARDVKYMYDFTTTTTSEDNCVNPLLLRKKRSAVPTNATGWLDFYNEITTDGDFFGSTASHCGARLHQPIHVLGDENHSTAIPIVLAVAGEHSLKVDVFSEARYESEADETDLQSRLYADRLNLEVFATRRYPDIVHKFDKDSHNSNAEKHDKQLADTAVIETKLLAAQHKRSLENGFQDDTTAIIKGAVVFPREWVGGSARCGMFEAKIIVSEIGAPESEEEEYFTDETGWFEFAVTRGKSYVFHARFPKHEICYTGTTIDGAQTVISCDDAPASVTIRQAGDGNFIFFTDVTKSNIDLGLYQGECDSRYPDAVFKITPVNGCHAPILVSSAQISGWMTNTHGLPRDFVEPDNARVWPFAAMDYSIMLYEGSRIDGVTDLINHENWVDGCANEGPGDMLHFFRRRNTLERLALMRDHPDWQSLRYKYHGFICVQIVDVPRIHDANAVCYNSSEPVGGIMSKHFIGASESPLLSIGNTKRVAMKVFELHKSGDTLTRCFMNLPTKVDGSGSTTIQIREDVGDRTSSPCHRYGNGGPQCDFDVTLDQDGYLIWPAEHDSTELKRHMSLVAGQPRLSGNHRRMLSASVRRDDTFFATTVTMQRELIVLGSKLRGGMGDSDDQFWATVPLDGLVYSVVHDPPGDSSHAEIASGTDLKIEFEITDTRAMGAGGDWEAGLGFYFEVGLKGSFHAGWVVEAGFEVDALGIEGELMPTHEETGPEFKVTGTRLNAWEMTSTTDRVITSSEDPSFPGRAGDVILGGGVELVYKLSDILDLRGDIGLGTHDLPCLYVDVGITWLPRKPTSYLFSVHTIENVVMPNLRMLHLVTQSGGITKDSSGLVYDCVDAEHCTTVEMQAGWAHELSSRINAWKRTLEWSAPRVYLTPKAGSPNEYEKDYSQVEAIKAPLLSENSLIGQELSAAETVYNDHLDESELSLATDLANEWSKFTLMSLLDFGMLPFPTLMLPYVNLGRLAGFIEGDVEPLTIGYSKEEAHRANLHDIFTQVDDANPVYSTGVNAIAAEWARQSLKSCAGKRCTSQGELRSTSPLIGGPNSDFVGEGNDFPVTDATRVSASFTGAEAMTGMVNRGGDSGEQPILLTFSGGGHALQFSFESEEVLDSNVYHIAYEFSGESRNSLGGEIKVHNIVYLKGSLAATQSREFSTERVLAWTKTGKVATHYYLADADVADKFVVSVGTDVRYGTPVFMTMGGRSACPGEEETVYRHSGIRLVTEFSHTLGLNPGQQAIFALKIVNESPYRDDVRVGLRLKDGLDLALQEIHKNMFSELDDVNATATSISRIINQTAQMHGRAGASAVVQRVKVAAASRANSGGSALDTTLAAAAAMQLAPPVGAEFRNAEFGVGLNHELIDLGDALEMIVFGDNRDGKQRVKETSLYLSVSPGVEQKIQYAQIELLSFCEAHMQTHGGMYRYPINSKISLDVMSWEANCPPVAFDATTMTRHAFTAVSQPGDSLTVNVFNPDAENLWPTSNALPDQRQLINDRLSLVRLQYRTQGAGEWITAKAEDSTEQSKKKNMLCDSSRLDGCRFEWFVNNQYEKLLSGFKDGLYEVRVKNFCFGGPSLALDSVHEYVSDQILSLSVDTVSPMERERTSSDERFYGITFYEPIDCSAMTVSVRKVNSLCGGTGVRYWWNVVTPEELTSFNIKCFNSVSQGHWAVEFPRSEAGRYKVTVGGIRDVAGNAAGDADFLADVHCSLAEAAAAADLGGAEGDVEKIRNSTLYHRDQADASLGASESRSTTSFHRGFDIKTVLAAFVVGACASALVIHGYLNRRLDGDARGKDVNVTRDKFNDESEESLLGPPAALPTYGTSV